MLDATLFKSYSEIQTQKQHKGPGQVINSKYSKWAEVFTDPLSKFTSSLNGFILWLKIN